MEALGVLRGSVIAALGVSAIALIWLPLSALWVALAWAGVCAVWALQRKSFVAFNIALALLALAAIEAVLGLQPRAWHWGDYENADYFGRDDNLGYSPRPGQRATHEKYLGDEQLYSVAYTIGEQGLRRSNPPGHDLDNECILFFGGSFTFGEGLNDEETLPYRVSQLLGPALSTRNFGIHGHGPHHMLARIESAQVADTVDCVPRVAVYLAIKDHVYRAAGLRWWDRRGPRFVLDEGGSARRRGNFDDDEGVVDEVLHFIQKRSEIAKRLRDRTRELEPGDYDLFFALLQSSQEQLLALYPGIEFITLEWDLSRVDASVDPELGAEFEARRLPVESLSVILERAGRGREGLTIPRDGHPTGRANEVLADAIAESVASRLGEGRGERNVDLERP